jgi:hypothetical protein
LRPFRRLRQRARSSRDSSSHFIQADGGLRYRSHDRQNWTMDWRNRKLHVEARDMWPFSALVIDEPGKQTHSFLKNKNTQRACFGMCSPISILERMQLMHIAVGFGGICRPHSQQRLDGAVSSLRRGNDCLAPSYTQRLAHLREKNIPYGPFYLKSLTSCPPTVWGPRKHPPSHDTWTLFK